MIEDQKTKTVGIWDENEREPLKSYKSKWGNIIELRLKR